MNARGMGPGLATSAGGPTVGMGLSNPSTTLRDGFFNTNEAMLLAREYYADPWIQECVSFQFRYAFGDAMSAEFAEDERMKFRAGASRRRADTSSDEENDDKDDDDDNNTTTSGGSGSPRTGDAGKRRGRGISATTVNTGAPTGGVYAPSNADLEDGGLSKRRMLAAQNTERSRDPSLPLARATADDARPKITSDGKRSRAEFYEKPAPSTHVGARAGARRWRSSRGFDAHLQEYFAPFAKEAMHHINIQGYAAYRIAHLADGVEVPHVLDIGTYHVRYELSRDYTIRYEVWAIDRASLVENAHVFMLQPPDMFNGQHRSVMRSVVTMNQATTQMLNFALRAEHINSAPPMVLQTSSRSGVGGGTGAGGAAEAELVNDSYGSLFAYREAQERQIKRTELEAQELEQKLRMVDALNSGDPTVQVDGHGGIFRREAANGLSNAIPLPASKEIGKQTLPTPRGDLVTLLEMRQTNVCVAFGVPRAVLIADSGAHAASVQAMSMVFKNKVAVVRDHASKLLCDVYHRIYGESDLFETVLGLTGNMHPAAPTCGGLNVSWVFGSIPTTSLEELRALYNDNIMSHRTYASAAFKIAGLNPGEVHDGADGGYAPPPGTEAAYAEHLEKKQHEHRMAEERVKCECAQKVEKTKGECALNTEKQKAETEGAKADAKEKMDASDTKKTLECVGAECKKMEAEKGLLEARGRADTAKLKNAERGLEIKQKAADQDHANSVRKADTDEKIAARKDKRKADADARKERQATKKKQKASASGASKSK